MVIYLTRSIYPGKILNVIVQQENGEMAHLFLDGKEHEGPYESIDDALDAMSDYEENLIPRC